MENLQDNQYIKLEDVYFTYAQLNDEGIKALRDINMEMAKGQHIAVLGRNGSGKSTLAKLLNALEVPDSGKIVVGGLQAVDETTAIEIRRICGMVFQNPDNQLIGTTIEEEIAFGPENLGVEPKKIRKRVDQCIRMVDLQEYRQKAPSSLSGGQKQKLAIAGILAMEPRVIILDEATSMLDPVSRRDFMNLCESLRKQYGLTFINITHHMNEVLLADYVYVIDKSKLLFQGKPAEIFSKVRYIQDLGLDVPSQITLLYHFSKLSRTCISDYLNTAQVSIWQDLMNRHASFLSYADSDSFNVNFPLNIDEVLNQLTNFILDFRQLYLKNSLSTDQRAKFFDFVQNYLSRQHTLFCLENRPQRQKDFANEDDIIEVKNLSYQYFDMEDSERKALNNLSFSLKRGEILGIMGRTGSGKSTLMQHLNALLKIQNGSIKVFGMDVDNRKNIFALRQKIGLLFQYPEHQLFAESVYEDIAYGPKNMGVDEAEIEKRVKESLAMVDLDESILKRSPFELSGGQKRRVALAGVLAMKPEILVLDEAAAGLDPEGRNEILKLILKLNKENVSIILVSHSMEDLAKVCDRIMVLQKGHLCLLASTKEVFADEERLQNLSLSLPDCLFLAHRIFEKIPYHPLNNCLCMKDLLFCLTDLILNQDFNHKSSLKEVL